MTADQTGSDPATVSDSEYPPWEPPFAGTEAEHVLGALDRLRATFRWKADGLDGEQIHRSAAPSGLSVAGLLKHLAVQEDYAAQVKITGSGMPSVWDDNGWDGDHDWEFSSATEQSPAELYSLYDAAVERSRAAIRTSLDERGLGGDSAVTLPDGTRASVRRILFDLLEEYGRHTGHLDLVREAVDGLVGEDPPVHWRPGQVRRP